MRGTRQRMGAALGTAGVGLSRYVLPAGARSMPVHAHASEEEIFHVLSGSGLAWIDGATFVVAAGDTIVHPAGGPPHTLVAGADGIDVLAFASGADGGLTYLPRPQVFWAGTHWLPADAPHPFAAEAACGPLELPEPDPARPSSIVALADAPADRQERPGYRLLERDLGVTAGSKRSGLRHVVLEPGQMNYPPHWHAQEEELFLVLEGDGELLLMETDLAEQRTPIAAGAVVGRPPATGTAHALVAGERGLTYLAYGTRVPGEVVYYPRSCKAWLGPLLVRVEPVTDYWDGEP